MAQKTKRPDRQPASLQKQSWFEALTSPRKDAVCIVVLYALILFLFGKIVFSDMIFSASADTAAVEAWNKAIDHIQETEHQDPLWIPYAFGGMPIFATLIFPRDVNYVERALSYVGRLLFLNSDLFWFILHFFLNGVFMYMLARQLKFSHLASLVAALTMMMSPDAIGLGEVGHGSKLVTLSYLPLLFMLTYNLFQKRDLMSIGLVSVVTGTLFLSRHPQIAFYGMMTIGCYLVYEVVLDVKTQPGVAFKKAALLAIALALGFAIYSYQFFPVNEYAKYSIRGGSDTGVSKGLDYDYATNWSFSPMETFGFVLPSFMGIVPDQKTAQDQLAYWGTMPFTNSVLYFGILPLILAIIAFIYNRSRLTWFLGIFSFLVLLISYGRNFGLLYDPMFRLVPYFNKFRTPVMILHLLPFTFGILAAYGFSVVTDLPQYMKGPALEKFQKRLRIAIVAIGAVLIFGLLANDALGSILSSFLFDKPGEAAMVRQQYGAQTPQVIAQLKKVRFDIFWSDYIKFAIFAGAILALIYARIREKVTDFTLGAGLIVILIIDLTIIDVKYINPQPKEEIDKWMAADRTVEAVKAESDTSLFRVYPLGRMDDENLMMYHMIQSLSGYSPAKLKIYQDMRDSVFPRGNASVFNMLNVKYFLGQQKAADGSVQTVAQRNEGCLPRAWFVDSIVVTSSKSEIFGLLNSPAWNAGTTAILEKNPPGSPVNTTPGSVSNFSYSTRDITMDVATPAPKLLVLSEIYYPAGWKAAIDGAETEIFKTNYILRSVVVPPGKHKVEFRFDPPSYTLGYTLSQAGWGVSIVLLLVGLSRHPSVRKRFGKGNEKAVPTIPGRP